ncbi:MAG: outer membrane lipid asymmetry maintenance protein MlaD [Casimicrobiaceae bacterium]
MPQRAIDLWVGLFVAAGLAALLFLALKVGNLLKFNEDARGYVIEARFDNIGNLKPRAPVRSAGVVVGRVESITLDGKTFEAVARLRIDNRFQFTRDTIAAIYTSGLLGEQFVGLEAGGDTVMLKDGDTLRKTQSAMQLEKLVSQFLFSRAADGANTSPGGPAASMSPLPSSSGAKP